MKDDQEKNRQNYEDFQTHCPTCVCFSSLLGGKYQDKYGDVWERTGHFTVRRVSDGHYGGWFNGKGLTLIKDEPSPTM